MDELWGTFKGDKEDTLEMLLRVINVSMIKDLFIYHVYMFYLNIATENRNLTDNRKILFTLLSTQMTYQPGKTKYHNGKPTTCIILELVSMIINLKCPGTTVS
jgi:hypothetical protein